MLGKFCCCYCCLNQQMPAFQKSPGSSSQTCPYIPPSSTTLPLLIPPAFGKPRISHLAQCFFLFHRNCGDSEWVLGVHSSENSSKRSWLNICVYMEDFPIIWVLITQRLPTRWNKFGLTPLLQINALY